MMVTPLRDGMNLVAQEFVLCQATAAELPGRWRGVLLLSEFAGAAHVLPGALLVNPWDANDMVARLVEALALDDAERHRRLDLMADRVEQLDSVRWTHGFLHRLEHFARRRKPGSLTPLDDAARARIKEKSRERAAEDAAARLRRHAARAHESPRPRRPTAEIRQLLSTSPRCRERPSICERSQAPDADNVVRRPADLPLRRARLPRAASREAAGRRPFEVDLSWLPRIERVLRRVARDVPGTLVERKTCSVAWHYRQAEPEYGNWRARELLDTLDQLLPGIPAEVLHGHRVIEVRARGSTRAPTCTGSSRVAGARAAVLAAGDDLTDLDLFGALPPGSIAIHVGRRVPAAA